MSARLRDDCFALPPGVDWTPVDDALARLREGLTSVTGVESAPLAKASGRVLAEDVRAMRDNPPAANSAIDGYAFAWEALGQNVEDEANLPLQTGRAAAGHPFKGTVPSGHALRILTGAELPKGTDTVVLQEDARVGAGRVRFQPPRKGGANSRGRGEDARAGEVVLSAGRRIAPEDLARLASVGVGEVPLRKPLRVAVLSTGDELIPAGEPPVPGSIYDSNRPMLSALIAQFGHDAVDLGAQQDRAGTIRAALDQGAEDADAILTTGGASAGDEDHISRLLRNEGTVTTWRIAVKPGRPLALGFWNGVPVFGLPGNPVAAFVCALMFARPALAVMAGQAWPEPLGVTVPAAFSKAKKPGRREYLRARLTPDGRAEVFHSEGSGLIGGLSWSDGLVELPDGALDVKPGTPVRYLPYAALR
ncbi:MAG: gephyrin-like molybdotransferase Glp [Pseudomonadota bacterium]